MIAILYWGKTGCKVSGALSLAASIAKFIRGNEHLNALLYTKKLVKIFHKTMGHHHRDNNTLEGSSKREVKYHVWVAPLSTLDLQDNIYNEAPRGC